MIFTYSNPNALIPQNKLIDLLQYPRPIVIVVLFGGAINRNGMFQYGRPSSLKHFRGNSIP